MTEKTQFEIGLILPAIPDANDLCVHRLAELLQSQEGIETVHVTEAAEHGQNCICIHYDPDRLSIGMVRELAKRAGTELDQRFGHLLMQTEATYAHRARTLEFRTQQIKGVLEASISPAGVVRIEFDRRVTDQNALEAELHRLGVHDTDHRRHQHEKSATVHKCRRGGHDHDHSGFGGERTELIFAGLSGSLLLAGWILSSFSVPVWLSFGAVLAAYVFGGFFVLREAVENLRAGRFEIDSLMLVAAMGAAILGKWSEGALLLFLFSVGHALEHFAMGRAKRAIEALADLAPQTALVRRDEALQELPIDQLMIGDLVIIKPNERIPADGFVVKGESSINQAPITGESMPVDKRPVKDAARAATEPGRLDAQFRVFTGTINQSGALEVQVTKLSTDSTLARIVELVNEAETRKASSQLFTDQFERYFVPAVIVFCTVLLFAWTIIDEPFSKSFYRAMAVLVAASPCALAISTPSAVLSGVARAARGGVLVKGGAPLEKLGSLSVIAFDKTGTLTKGKSRLIDVVSFDESSETELLGIAVAVEDLSDHPLASAVVRGGLERLAGSQLPIATELQSITGRGVKAKVNDQTVYLGKGELFKEVAGIPLPDILSKRVAELEQDGRTTMIVRQGTRYLGVLGLMDTPRESAKSVIAKLRELGIQKTVMLSGDNQDVVNAIAQQIGIDEAWGDLMPDGKVELIKRLSQGGVAMVGEGVNDAPAMANATVGIVMGAAGSDVALETADVALMADDLSRLPFAIGLSRQTRRVIQQNLWFSLGMVVILVPATVFGLQMGAAVLFHEGSTILVVINALRLLAYQSEDQ